MTDLRLNQNLIGITIGDPTGVGPEVIVAALQDRRIWRVCTPVIIGRPKILERACRVQGFDSEVRVLDSIESLQTTSFEDDNVLYCLCVGDDESDLAIEPKVDARGGRLAFEALEVATTAALGGDFSAIVTAPLHKQALHEAGYRYPGHTEILAELCGVEQYAMMLYLPPGQNHRGGPAGLGVIHVTLHMALREVFSHLTSESIIEKIRLADQAFRRLRTTMQLPPAPRLAVAALNPHAGEGGLFGREEIETIRPAVESAKRDGINVEGPLSTDTLMPHAVAGEFDAVIAMYHDQGHIALKLLDMFDAVNITLGLPIVRTSVAHGTAHDLAWTGKARSSGMVQAILAAARLGKTKRGGHIANAL